MEETSARINAMVEIGKQNIEMSEIIPLDCLVNIKKYCNSNELYQ